MRQTLRPCSTITRIAGRDLINDLIRTSRDFFPLSHCGRGCPHEVRAGEGSLSADAHPLYLPIEQNVRWKRLSALAGGHRLKRAAMSPDTPPANNRGEPGIFAVSRTTEQSVDSRSHEQGRLP